MNRPSKVWASGDADWLKQQNALRQLGEQQQLTPEQARLVGLVTPGNIDLTQRVNPLTWNPDGSYSTLRSSSFGTDQGEVLVPTVVNRQIVPDQQALAQYQQTGQHLGVFRSPDDADRYGQYIHQRLADLYDQRKQQWDAALQAKVPWPASPPSPQPKGMRHA